MSDDEKKQPRISLSQTTMAILGAVFGTAFQEQARALSMLQPIHYHPVGKRGGALAHRQWKRRRAAGWDR